MALHPDAQTFLALRASQGSRDVKDLTVEQARAQSLRLNTLVPGEPVARTRDLEISGPNGTIPARLYYPTDADHLPIIVFFHGGGFVVGSLETTDVACRQLANASGCLVVSVNYRHAPEHKFPAAAEDAYAATAWVSAHAAELSGDATRLAVVGTSAGGNLAAVTALMARAHGTPPIALQALWVPVLDFDFDTRSYHENAEGYGLTRAGMQWFWTHYLADESDGANPYASPIRAADVSNLPPAFVMTTEYDPLQDEGRAYAQKLKAAGVTVEHRHYAGMIHGYPGAQAFADATQALRTALGVK